MLLLVGNRAFIVAHSHATEPESRNFQAALSKDTFLHFPNSFLVAAAVSDIAYPSIIVCVCLSIIELYFLGVNEAALSCGLVPQIPLFGQPEVSPSQRLLILRYFTRAKAALTVF